MTKGYTFLEEAIVDFHQPLLQEFRTAPSHPNLDLFFPQPETVQDDLWGPTPGTQMSKADWAFCDLDTHKTVEKHVFCTETDIDESREHIEIDFPNSTPGSDFANSDRSLLFRRRRRHGKRPALVTSAFFHSALLCVMAFFPAIHVAGAGGTGENTIIMKVAAAEDLVPQDASPASIDSAASAAAKAKRDKHQDSKSEEAPKEQPIDPEAGPSPKLTEMKEDPLNRQDGNAPMDSVASVASTASAERQFISAAGQEGSALDAKVLSAIRESIFFPRDALNRRHHGEVTVAFAVAKDGSLQDLRVVKPSESSILNEAAIKIIEKAAKKFPSIPPAMFKERLDYVVPILFRENRKS
jgi:TonB family protein